MYIAPTVAVAAGNAYREATSTRVSIVEMGWRFEMGVGGLLAVPRRVKDSATAKGFSVVRSAYFI